MKTICKKTCNHCVPGGINAGYTLWSDWSECSETCGGGTTKRNRFCTKPEPKYGGKTCKGRNLGNDVQTKSCNTQDCPSSTTCKDSAASIMCQTYKKIRKCSNVAMKTICKKTCNHCVPGEDDQGTKEESMDTLHISAELEDIKNDLKKLKSSIG